ncbi:uncharacterized protein BcabD6B2_06060 [Babesia caballi]|uniref:rRNA biogenesis protein RRP36 n=1 Tax=Babesia caballi TaxID=5871 RepID=A0AAV4LMB6_BABCB|nr:hypothetical protein, conserved [Babesia caballi]
MAELTLGELKALREREASSDHQEEAEQDQGHTGVHKERRDARKRPGNAGETRKGEPKKRSTKAPAMLPNNAAFNPYTTIKFGKKGADSRLKARDPRFSDFSGTLNDDLFRKSYAFLGDMLQDEVKEIKAALRVGERAGINSVKAASALNGIAHMDITSMSDAKRALDRYKTQQKQLQSDRELRELKKGLIEQEKQKIATTSKTPFYYSDKKVRKILRAKEEAEQRAALESAAINANAAGGIHKKLAKAAKRKTPKQPRVGAGAGGKPRLNE